MGRFCSRLETQSCPPDYDGGESYGCGEIDGEFVVSGCDSAEVLEPAEHAFDPIALSVGDGIEGVTVFPGWIVRDDRSGSAFGQELAQPVAVVGCIGRAQPPRRQRRQECDGGPHVAKLARRYFEGDGASGAIDDGVDFCRAPASRPANRLRRRPPFPPAAERCALAVVLSIICMSSGVTVTRARNSRCHTPRPDQR